MRFDKGVPYSESSPHDTQTCHSTPSSLPITPETTRATTTHLREHIQVHPVIRMPTIVSWLIQTRGCGPIRWDKADTFSKYHGSRGHKHLLTGEMELEGGLEEVLSSRFYVLILVLLWSYYMLPMQQHEEEGKQLPLKINRQGRPVAF